MYVTSKKFGMGREILASEKYVSFSVTVKAADVQRDENGQKIIKAGTVWPKNDETAEGLILDDVNLDYGDQPAALLVEGYVYEGRLPEEVTAEALAAMPEIKYRKTK